MTKIFVLKTFEKPSVMSNFFKNIATVILKTLEKFCLVKKDKKRSDFLKNFGQKKLKL